MNQARKYKIALFIGRFQPLHNGHVYGIKKTLEIAEKVIVVIGSSNEGGTENNPFNFETRKKMIEEGLQGLSLKVTIVGVPDNPSDQVWLNELIKRVGKFDVVASNNEWVLTIMKAAGYKTFETGLFNRDELEGVKIRALMRAHDSSWETRVPEQVARQIAVGGNVPLGNLTSQRIDMSKEIHEYNYTMSIKLVSVNIEGQKHLDTVRELLVKEKAEVVCLMECRDVDLDSLLTAYPHRVYGPNCRLKDGSKMGVVVASREPITNAQIFYPDGGGSEIPLEGLGSHRPVCVSGRIGEFKIGAIHFTWTPNMSETERQNLDLGRLLRELAGKEITLTGDFNIPRGNGAYRQLAQKYRDNIPPDITTTIDWENHRAKREGKEKFEAVVDYLWSTPKYRVENVRVISGISDHCALVCQIDKI